MEYLDANNNPIKPGVYCETFFKEKDAFPFCTGKDEFRNRIVYIGPRDSSSPRLFSIINRANMAPLNPNYSRWLRPFDEELEAIAQETSNTEVSPTPRDNPDSMNFDGDSTPDPKKL